MGQNELQESIKNNYLLQQRINTIFSLKPFDFSDTTKYIIFRQKKAGSKSVDNAALAFQVVMSVLLLYTIRPISQVYMTSNNVNITMIPLFVIVALLSVVIYLCTIVANVLFYIFYFDKTLQQDKNYQNLVTGFQSTMFLIAPAMFGMVVTLPCIFFGDCV